MAIELQVRAGKTAQAKIAAERALRGYLGSAPAKEAEKRRRAGSRDSGREGVGWRVSTLRAQKFLKPDAKS
jgi:hypothetical protein